MPKCSTCNEDEVVLDDTCGSCLDAFDRYLAEIEYTKPIRPASIFEEVSC